MLNEAYSNAQFMLELDSDGKSEKERMGFIRSVDGGGIRSEVLSYRYHVGRTWAVSRQIGAKPTFDDIKIEVGMSLSEDFYFWIEDFFRGGMKDGVIQRRSGSIVAADIRLVERARRNFTDALISEVAFPKLDAADTNAAYLGVTIVPESVVTEFPESYDETKKIVTPGDAGAQKLWAPNNFEFTFDGFDDSFIRAVRVDGFTIRQQILEYPTGYRISHDAEGAPVSTGPGNIRVPGIIEFPNITVYVPEPDLPALQRAYEKAHVAKETANARSDGHLIFQGHQSEELCRITLGDMDIASISPDRGDAGGREVKLAKVEFACERMEFKYPRKQGSAQASAPA